MKPCNACDSWLPLTAYYVDARNNDGRSGTCIECQRDAARERHRTTYIPLNTMRQARNTSGQFTRTIPCSSAT